MSIDVKDLKVGDGKGMTWGQALHACARFVLAGATLAAVLFLVRWAWRLGGVL